MSNRYHEKRLIQNIPHVICVFNTDGKLLYTNAQWHKSLGYTLEDSKDFTYVDFIHSSSLADFELKLQKILQGSLKEKINITFITQSGLEITTEGQLIAAIENDEIVTIDGIFEDVSAQVETEEIIESYIRDLEVRNRELEYLNELSATVTSGNDLQTILYEIARIACEALHGTSTYISLLDETYRLSTTITEYFSPQVTESEQESDLNAVYNLVADFPRYREWLLTRNNAVYVVYKDDDNLDSGYAEHMAEYDAKSILHAALIIKDKAIGVLEVWESRQYRRYEKNEFDLLTSIARQASLAIAKAQLDQNIFESEQRYRNLLQNAYMLIYITDFEGIFQYANPFWYELLEYRPEELINIQYTHIFLPEALTAYREISNRVRLGSQKETLETIFVTKSGKQIIVEGYLTPQIADGKIQGIQGIFHDITERVNSEKQIKQQNIILRETNEKLEIAKRQAEESTRLKSEFLATMSHELRTPLNAIIGFTEIQLAGMTGDLTPEQIDYQKQVLQSGEQLLKMINDILDLSKIEAGRMEISNQPFDLYELAQIIFLQYQTIAEQNGLELNLNLDPGLPEIIIGDQIKVQQIAITLLSNAIKFTESGKITLSIQKENENKWQLQVSDTGIGIPNTMLDSIFDEFRQLDGSYSRKHGGTGLGLALVRKLLNLLEGDIEIESEVGVGSTFTVSFPLISEYNSESSIA